MKTMRNPNAFEKEEDFRYKLLFICFPIFVTFVILGAFGF